MQPIVHWFRRDLRLRDNTALLAAHRASGGAVVPVFVQSDWNSSHRWTGTPRQEFLCKALQALTADIDAHGGQLVFRRGKADDELERVVRETGAAAIYFNRDPDPFGIAMERRVQAMAQRLGIEAAGYDDATALPPDSVVTGSGQMFRVYTPYARAWMRRPTPQPGPLIPRFAPVPRTVSLPAPTLASWGLPSGTVSIPEAGEKAARKRLDAFFNGSISRYAAERDCPAASVTSHLSPDLRWGTISIRELIRRTRDAGDSATDAPSRSGPQKFLGELIWREFYFAVLWRWPSVLEREFQQQFIGLSWLWPGRPIPDSLAGTEATPAEAFARWCEGTTGFPIVDAGMRQLAATGWMHNRVRMIVAMFLTKDLHLDWRLGEQFFMQRLIDGEIASNNGGWQWSAGTGADAAPYFRIQNPWKQTGTYDPAGDYIKTWVPELREIHPALLMKPPSPGQRLARDYPPPIVDHTRERGFTLEMFRVNRHGSST